MRAVNLIPAEQRSGGTVGARSQGAAFAVLGLLAGAAILIFMYGSASHQLDSSKAEVASLTKQTRQIQAQAAQLSSYTSFVQMREQRLQEISQLINSRFNWSGVLGEFSRVLPASVALSTLQGTIGSASAAVSAKPAAAVSASATAAAAAASSAAASATPAGSTPTFSLNGCATSQLVVAQMLVRLRLVSGVGNVTLQSSTKGGSGGANSTSGGGSAGGSGSGSCPPSAPAFSAQVTFQPLPTPPTTSTEALESTVSASGSGHTHEVSNRATGAKR